LKIVFFGGGWADYRALREAEPKVFAKLDGLIDECCRHPFRGTGKPEPLKENLKGWWSRRITQEHRLVYRVTGSGDDQALEIVQCRFHY
jgi:toxin YoeB